MTGRQYDIINHAADKKLREKLRQIYAPAAATMVEGNRVAVEALEEKAFTELRDSHREEVIDKMTEFVLKSIGYE